jgi:hypothetical protein
MCDDAGRRPVSKPAGGRHSGYDGRGERSGWGTWTLASPSAKGPFPHRYASSMTQGLPAMFPTWKIAQDGFRIERVVSRVME